MSIDEFGRELGDRLAAIVPREQRGAARALAADQVHALLVRWAWLPRTDYEALLDAIRDLETAVTALDTRLAAVTALDTRLAADAARDAG